MPAILTNNLSVINAENFVDSFVNGESNIFMAIGKGWEEGDSVPTNTTPDMVNKWDDEMNPPVPVDSITRQREFRETILGIKKIMLNDILIMVPRVDWVENRIFATKSWDDKVGVRATDYYCLTSNNEVWECVHTPANKSLGVTVEPVLPEELTKLHKIDETVPDEYKLIGKTYYVFKESTNTDECYWWRYLYTIPVATANKKLLDTWMPVMFNKHGVYPGGTLIEEQDSMRGDLNANRTLGAYRVMISCTLKDEDTIIPYDTVYRQIGLIVDPLSPKSKNEDSIQTRLGGNSYNEDQFDIYSGELVYLENKRAIMREQNQEETLNLILVF